MGGIEIKNNKEIVFYFILLIILISIVLLNNIFWKLGKERESTENNIDYLKSNNVIYNVPYEEKVLD